MTQPQTYQGLRELKEKEARLNQKHQMDKQSVGGEVDESIAGSKNPVLQNYMKPDEGLGSIDPRSFVMGAVEAAQGKNPEQYSQSRVESAIGGQVDPQEVLADPNVADNDKAVLLSLLQGGPQDAAPEGLGQIPQ